MKRVPLEVDLHFVELKTWGVQALSPSRWACLKLHIVQIVHLPLLLLVVDLLSSLGVDKQKVELVGSMGEPLHHH